MNTGTRVIVLHQEGVLFSGAALKNYKHAQHGRSRINVIPQSGLTISKLHAGSFAPNAHLPDCAVGGSAWSGYLFLVFKYQ
jgi:hypothetical protein